MITLSFLLLIISGKAVSSTGNISLVPLNMDIEWVLQGGNMSFQGFFVEFLGLSRAVRHLLPQTRFVKSFFRHSLFESSIQSNSSLFNELFEKEKLDLQWLIDNELNYNVQDIHYPKSAFNKESIKIDNEFEKYCDNLNDMNNVDTIKTIDQIVIGGDFAKSFSKSIESPIECCKMCSRHHLCVGWNFYVGDQLPLRNGCYLKGSKGQHSYSISSPGSYSDVMKYKDSNGVIKIRHPLPRAVIFHGTSCFYKNISIAAMKRDVNEIYIGRYMLERMKFRGGLSNDEYYVAACAAVVDEVWVPTEWHKVVFQDFMGEMGFPSPMIAVVPEAVDTTLFDPDLVDKKSFDSFFKSDISIDGTNNNNNNNNYYYNKEKRCFIDTDGHVKCDNPSELFQFLSIFKWEHRKGWDILLSAYWNAFSKSDQVILRIRSYLPSSDKSGEKNITLTIERYAMQVMGKKLDELARVVWESGPSPDRRSDSMSRMDMRDLYKSADCFVLPTRGEGWGLPIAEAMSMRLPVIVTNFSGPTAFCFDNNSYLLNLKPVPDDFDFLSFANPDDKHLIQLMKQVIIDSSTFINIEVNNKLQQYTITQLKGIEARKTMEFFSPEYVVTKIQERLKYHANRRGWEF